MPINYNNGITKKNNSNGFTLFCYIILYIITIILLLIITK